MKRESLEKNGINYWVTADNFVYWENGELVEAGKFLAFYSFQVPGVLLYGESVKGPDGLPLPFSTEAEALNAAKVIAEYKINLEKYPR